MSPRKKPCDMAPNEWCDGAGILRTEKWVVLVTKTRRDGGGDDRSMYGDVMGTREQAEKLLADMANGWARDDRLAIARIYEPEVIQHTATITWRDHEDTEEDVVPTEEAD